ncbi:MAG: LacI family DNA-binding transcriptional regulator [Opitutaceae bacterium]|nr:LacI family DNA-binding transcriptional regulator [Opitutaceae bacterium]
MSKPATLQDVAVRAGVHRTTVSLALRDHPRIPATTREHVKAVAARLGYRMNPLVSALMRSRRTGGATKHVTLAFVTNYPTRDGWRPVGHGRPDFFPGAEQKARDLGYRLEHFWLAEPGMTPARLCDVLSARGIHGLITGRLPPGQASLSLAWDRFSCVALGMTLRSPALHRVTENHFETVTQAMHQCEQRGYRRVGFVFSAPNDSPCVGDRWLGAYLVQQRLVPAGDRVPLCPGVPADEPGFAAWFRANKPDAILATHAKPLLDWLARLGRKAPRDVGLVELEEHPELGCAGVHYDSATIGALAVEMLVGLMHRCETGVPANPHEVLLTGTWREGRTLPARSLRPAARPASSQR